MNIVSHEEAKEEQLGSRLRSQIGGGGGGLLNWIDENIAQTTVLLSVQTDYGMSLHSKPTDLHSCYLRLNILFINTV